MYYIYVYTRACKNPTYHRAMCESLRIRCLAQGYLSNTLKVSWRLPLLPAIYPNFVHLGI